MKGLAPITAMLLCERLVNDLGIAVGIIEHAMKAADCVGHAEELREELGGIVDHLRSIGLDIKEGQALQVVRYMNAFSDTETKEDERDEDSDRDRAE